jgi:hypothetical protein
VPLRQEWFVEPRPDGCRVVARGRFEGFTSWLLPLLRMQHRWATMLDEQVRMLKRVCETL